MNERQFGIYGQWLAVLLQLIGLMFVIFTDRSLFHVFVISGSLCLTLATKVRYYGLRLTFGQRKRVDDTVPKEEDSNRKEYSALRYWRYSYQRR